MKYFGIFNETAVKNLKLNGKKAILIRIFEPNNSSNEHYKIYNETSYQAILELYLYDYVKEIKENALNEEFIKLNEFILQNNFDEVIIHCTLGVSRSPAIMICIAKILKNIELEIWIKENFKHYNQYIVSSFEKYPYISKDIPDNNFIYAYDNLNKVNKEFFTINEFGMYDIDLSLGDKQLKKLKK